MDNFASGIKESIRKAHKAFLEKQEMKQIISKKHECLCGRIYRVSVAIPAKFSDKVTDENILVEAVADCEYSSGDTGMK